MCTMWRTQKRALWRAASERCARHLRLQSYHKPLQGDFFYILGVTHWNDKQTIRCAHATLHAHVVYILRGRPASKTRTLRARCLTRMWHVRADTNFEKRSVQGRCQVAARCRRAPMAPSTLSGTAVRAHWHSKTERTCACATSERLRALKQSARVCTCGSKTGRGCMCHHPYQRRRARIQRQSACAQPVPRQRIKDGPGLRALNNRVRVCAHAE